MIGEECVLEFFQGLESRGQGLSSQGQGHQELDSQGQDQGLQNCPRGRGLVLEDSNTGFYAVLCHTTVCLQHYKCVPNRSTPS